MGWTRIDKQNLKERVVELLVAGNSHRVISRELHLSTRTVYKWNKELKIKIEAHRSERVKEFGVKLDKMLLGALVGK
jgi:transposase